MNGHNIKRALDAAIDQVESDVSDAGGVVQNIANSVVSLTQSRATAFERLAHLYIDDKSLSTAAADAEFSEIIRQHAEEWETEILKQRTVIDGLRFDKFEASKYIDAHERDSSPTLVNYTEVSEAVRIYLDNDKHYKALVAEHIVLNNELAAIDANSSDLNSLTTDLTRDLSGNRVFQYLSERHVGEDQQQGNVITRWFDDQLAKRSNYTLARARTCDIEAAMSHWARIRAEKINRIDEVISATELRVENARDSEGWHDIHKQYQAVISASDQLNENHNTLQIELITQERLLAGMLTADAGPTRTIVQVCSVWLDSFSREKLEEIGRRTASPEDDAWLAKIARAEDQIEEARRLLREAELNLREKEESYRRVTDFRADLDRKRYLSRSREYRYGLDLESLLVDITGSIVSVDSVVSRVGQYIEEPIDSSSLMSTDLSLSSNTITHSPASPSRTTSTRFRTGGGF